MPSKNDLTAYKPTPKHTLTQVPGAGVGAGEESRKKPEVKGGATRLVGLKLTEDEYNALKAKAGLVPLATFIKDYLRNNTDYLG